MKILVSEIINLILLVLVLIYQKKKGRSISSCLLVMLLGMILVFPAALLEQFFPIIPGFIEEGVRFIAIIFVLIIEIFVRKRKLSRFDYVLCGVELSLGIAILENFLWDYESGIKTALIRMLTPGHVFYGILIGYALFMFQKYLKEHNLIKGILFGAGIPILAGYAHNCWDLPILGISLLVNKLLSFMLVYTVVLLVYLYRKDID